MTDPTAPSPQRCFVVLGCHRAGTSVITRILQILGLYLGEDERLLGAIEHDNDKGFYEHRELMYASDELLARMGGSWRDPPALGAGWEHAPGLDDLREHCRRLITRDFGDRPRWGFKDPRASLTLPFWRTVTAPAGHVVVYRSPLAVARSLERRNGIALEYGVALWTHYTASAIANTINQRRIIARYEDLFSAGAGLVSELAALLAVPDPKSDPPLSAAIKAAIDPELRHHAETPGELTAHPAMSWAARELHELLAAGASPELDTLAAQILAAGPPAPRRVAALAKPRHLGPRPPRIVAMLQVYNERRFLAGCIEHLREQGIGVYVIDNESTDDTLELAQRYLGKGVIGIETLARDGCFALRVQCKRQEELAGTLDADWLIHHDADEIRVSPQRGQTLAEAIAEFDDAGFNAVNFLEFAFIPTREFPDHEHPGFARTMRWYYPFAPRFPHRCNAWRRQDGPVDLTTEAGHLVSFPGLRMAPRSLYMRHYLFISRQHAVEKFVQRRFAEDELDDGWFGWRARLRPEMIELPSVSDLRAYVGDHRLDGTEPHQHHLLEELTTQAAAPAAG